MQNDSTVAFDATRLPCGVQNDPRLLTGWDSKRMHGDLFHGCRYAFSYMTHPRTRILNTTASRGAQIHDTCTTVVDGFAMQMGFSMHHLQ